MSITAHPRVNANGTSVLKRRAPAITGWFTVYPKHRQKIRRHLFFRDYSTGCRAEPNAFAHLQRGGGAFDLKDAPKCKLCQAVAERYMRDAGVELFEALNMVELQTRGWLTEAARKQVLKALDLALNRREE